MYLTGQLGPRRGGCPTKMVVRRYAAGSIFSFAIGKASGKSASGLSEAPSSLMRARLIILRHPAIEVGLQLGDRPYKVLRNATR